MHYTKKGAIIWYKNYTDLIGWLDQTKAFRRLWFEMINKRVLDSLIVAKDEIMWYFDNYDRDALGNIKTGKKDPKIIDHRIAELTWLYKACWSSVYTSKDSITFLIH